MFKIIQKYTMHQFKYRSETLTTDILTMEVSSYKHISKSNTLLTRSNVSKGLVKYKEYY